MIRSVRGDRRREVLAAACGCSLMTVYRWEQGVTIPTDYRHIRALVEEGVDEAALVAALDARVAG